VQISYQLLRNTTSPDEESTSVRSYIANLPAYEILKFSTKENLRGYIAEYNPKKRNKVHDAIRTTILQEPQRFITRNSGFVISAMDITVDDKAKEIILKDPSIINGAQSQGEIKRWYEETVSDEDAKNTADTPFYVRAEIIVDSDGSEVVETAIARNTATPVQSISQAGARGHLDELEESIQKVLPDVKIRKKETEVDVFDTRKILQLTRLLMPLSVSKNDSPAERLRAYKNPEQCLTDFSNWFETKNVNPDAKAKYEFTIQIAAYAITENTFWETNESWNGHRLWEETKKAGRVCRRAKGGKIVWVSPALVFPILGAMSEFVQQGANGKWQIAKPNIFKPDEMVRRAVSQFRSYNSDPMLMGRNPAVYDALRIYPSTLIEVMRDAGQSLR